MLKKTYILFIDITNDIYNYNNHLACQDNLQEGTAMSCRVPGQCAGGDGDMCQDNAWQGDGDVMSRTTGWGVGVWVTFGERDTGHSCARRHIAGNHPRCARRCCARSPERVVHCTALALAWTWCRGLCAQAVTYLRVPGLPSSLSWVLSASWAVCPCTCVGPVSRSAGKRVGGAVTYLAGGLPRHPIVVESGRARS